MGIIRWLSFLWTLIIAGSLALNGVTSLIDGAYVEGALFLGAATVTFAIFESLYIKLVGWIGVGRPRTSRPVSAR